MSPPRHGLSGCRDCRLHGRAIKSVRRHNRRRVTEGGVREHTRQTCCDQNTQDIMLLYGFRLNSLYISIYPDAINIGVKKDFLRNIQKDLPTSSGQIST